MVRYLTPMLYVYSVTSLKIAYKVARKMDSRRGDKMKKKEYEQAAAAYKKATEISPTDPAGFEGLANAYNASTLFTGNEAMDPDLNAYVTQRALDGLFLLLAEEEERIREDPLARTSSMRRGRSARAVRGLAGTGCRPSICAWITCAWRAATSCSLRPSR